MVKAIHYCLYLGKIDGNAICIDDVTQTLNLEPRELTLLLVKSRPLDGLHQSGCPQECHLEKPAELPPIWMKKIRHCIVKGSMRIA